MFVVGAALRGAGGNGICALATGASNVTTSTATAHKTDNAIR
jgi:hypothetical protein